MTSTFHKCIVNHFVGNSSELMNSYHRRGHPIMAYPWSKESPVHAYKCKHLQRQRIRYGDCGNPRARRVKRLPCAQSTSIIRRRRPLSAATLPKDPRLGPKWETKTQRMEKGYSSRKTDIAHSRTETKHFKLRMLRFRCRVGAKAIAVQTEKQLKRAEN